MANVFDRLLTKLSGTKEGVLPSAQAFPPIDAHQLEGDLRDAARVRGNPVSDLEIRQALEVFLRRAEDSFRSQLEIYDGRIRRAQVLSNLSLEIQAAGEGALANLKVQTLDELNRLRPLRESALEHSSDLSRFRSEHHLKRPPVEVSGTRVRLGIALIVLFVVVETIVNGIFFAQGSELGLIGGAMEAIALAALNVGAAALFAAMGLPYLRHHRPFQKLFGFICLSGYLFWLVGFNLAIAHYRDLYASGRGVVSASTWLHRVVSEPWSLDAMQSWILAVLGVAFSLATLIDVAGLNDRYPGYGSRARRRRGADAHYTESVSDSLKGLESTRDEAVSGMSRVVTSIREAHYDLELSLSGRARLLENLKAYIEHTSLTYRQLSERIAGSSDISSQWIGTPDIPPVPAYSTEESKSAARRMEALISDVNAHYIEAAQQLAITSPSTSVDVA
jgi:hypothetical protein